VQANIEDKPNSRRSVFQGVMVSAGAGRHQPTVSTPGAMGNAVPFTVTGNPRRHYRRTDLSRLEECTDRFCHALSLSNGIESAGAVVIGRQPSRSKLKRLLTSLR